MSLDNSNRTNNPAVTNHNTESIWKRECRFEKREQLKNDINAEVVIIGAGMAGLLTAFLLKKKGIDTVVLEANEIASGQTQNTTGKITSQHALIYDNLLQKFGREKAQQYGMANEAAIQMYADMISEYNISCHFERLPAYVYTKEDVSKIEKEVKAAEEAIEPEKIFPGGNMKT